MTPEVFQALHERDRGLADQFDLLRVEAMGEETTRRVMIDVHVDAQDLTRAPAVE